MSDFLDQQGAKDLNTDAIHISAVANSIDPVTGAPIDTHVNRVGGTDYTLQGFWNAVGPVVMPWTSVVGGTLTQPNQAFLHPTNGNYYSWTGAYPAGGYVVAPGTDPAAVAGYVPRTDVVLRNELLENEMLNMSPLYHGAIGDATTNDTAAFTALEAAVSNRTIDMGDRVYLVDHDFTGNKYVNGYFRFPAKLLPDAEFTETRLQTRGKGVPQGFRSSTPNHTKHGLLLATIKNTPIQGAILDYYDNILYVLQNVSGTLTDNNEVNKIVAYNWFGQDYLTPLWETQGSLDLGHQGIGLTIKREGFRNTRGHVEIWGIAGVSKSTDRHQYLMRCQPVAGQPIVPEFFRMWDDSYTLNVGVVCTDPMSQWLVCTAKKYVAPGLPGEPDQMRYYVKVYDTSVFINPTDYGYDYRNAAAFEFEIADFIRDMQAVACDGTAIYFVQAGSSYSTTKKYIHKYTLDGIYLGVQQTTAGAGRAWDIGDPNGDNVIEGDLRYEPEAMFFRLINGGYDLVIGNTNGVPIGDTDRETSFYTIMPQQCVHIKTTSSNQPGLISDAAYDFVTNSGTMVFGKLEDGGAVTTHMTLTKGLAAVENDTAVSSQFAAKNSLRAVTYHVSAAGDAGIYDYSNARWMFKSPLSPTGLAYIGQPLEVDGPIRPFTTNTASCGTSTRVWTQVYATNTTINPSDARLKNDPLTAEQLAEYMQVNRDAILDAWGAVNIIAYQWLSDIQAKGEGVARWHFGVIAQQVRDAFLAHGVDGTRLGLLCYDEWEDEFRPVMAWRDVVTNYQTPEGDDASYTTKEEYDTGEKELVVAAGNRWGIRATECLWLEAAYQRRRSDRMESRVSALEAK